MRTFFSHTDILINVPSTLLSHSTHQSVYVEVYNFNSGEMIRMYGLRLCRRVGIMHMLRCAGGKGGRVELPSVIANDDEGIV